MFDRQVKSGILDLFGDPLGRKELRFQTVWSLVTLETVRKVSKFLLGSLNVINTDGLILRTLTVL